MEFEHLLSIPEIIHLRSVDTPDKTAFTFNNKGISYQQLWVGIQKFASLAHKLGVKPGTTVIVCLPNSFEFFFAFYGLQLIGSIPVPIFPNSGFERILSISRLAASEFVVVPSSLSHQQKDKLQLSASPHGLNIIIPERANEIPLLEFPVPQKPNNIAFIQYTSGSTGNPKGVTITHENLLTNVRQMIAGMKITPQEIFVSWLPTYHDMGLILKTMVPFYLGAIVHLLPTNLADVHPWLDAIQEHKATFTAAPDFAYRLCLRHVDPKSYDLSSLRVALNAAEPVRLTTILEFERAFNLEKIIVAGYGLAEATVGVSMWQPGTRPLVDSAGHISVGKPFPDIQVKIVSDGNELAPYQIGEIAIQSTANTQGYFQNLIATKNILWKDHFLLSGDLGYLDPDGHLFIVSRKKNIIKRGGQTISPQEIEEIVDRSSYVRYSAAIGIDRGSIEGEQVVILAEIRNQPDLNLAALHRIAVDTVAHVHKQLGFRPARIYLLKPRSIPLTHNGKIQHQKLKQLLTDNTLHHGGLILYPRL